LRNIRGLISTLIKKSRINYSFYSTQAFDLLGDSEISDFVYSVLSILKIVLDEKSKIGKLVLDDRTSSLMTAYNLTQKFAKI
jgi:hypothetical protein